MSDMCETTTKMEKIFTIFTKYIIVEKGFYPAYAMGETHEECLQEIKDNVLDKDEEIRDYILYTFTKQTPFKELDVYLAGGAMHYNNRSVTMKRKTIIV